MEGRLDIAHTMELIPQPGLAQALGIGAHFLTMGLAALECIEDRLGGGHARLHGGMGTLDFRHVQKAGAVTDQQAARETQLGNRLETAGADGPCAIGQTPPAFKLLADRGMGLETLHLLERTQIGILIIEADHEADRDQIVLEVIGPRAAVGLDVHRPAGGMRDGAAPMLARLYLP